MKNCYILLVLILCACGNPDKTKSTHSLNQPLQTIKVDPSRGETVKLSDLYEITKFIPLETSEDFLVDGIGKVVFAEEKIFILSRGILIFDNQGKFVSKIDKKGFGPAEYRTLWDIRLDTANNTIEALDTPGRKIITYDFNGNALDTWQHDLIVESFYKTGDTYLFYCGSNFNNDISKQLLLMDRKSAKPKAAFFKIDENQAKFMHITNNSRFSVYNNTLSFYDSFNDTIFTITDTGPMPVKLIDFGKYKTPDEILYGNYENVAEFVQDIRKKEYAFAKNAYFENDDIIFFAFEFKDEARFVYHYKHSGETKIISAIEDNMIPGSPKVSDIRKYAPIGKYNDEMILMIQPSDLITMVAEARKKMSDEEWQRYEQQHPDVIDVFKNAKLTDNPILCLTKMKL